MNKETREDIRIFKHDIKKFSAKYIWKRIDKISICEHRLYYRWVYNQAIKELDIAQEPLEKSKEDDNIGNELEGYEEKYNVWKEKNDENIKKIDKRGRRKDDELLGDNFLPEFQDDEEE